jgi:hypothetical protein
MPGGGGMGRLLGFGFLFGAKDDGAVRMTDDISGGMDRMVEATERVGRESAGIGRLGNFINALNLRQLTRVGDAMESLADRAGALAGEVSSTTMESFGAEYAQTYRAATAGMGEFRGEVDRVRGEIGSLAFNLGIGADEMLSYATTVARTGMSLDDFGIEMRSVAGSIQANILSGEQLGDVLTGLARGYDLGAEGATRVLDTVTAIGERFGVGADAARALPEVMQAVDQAASRFPSIAGNVDTAIESITRLGIAQQQRLGGTFQEGIQSAIEVFNQLAGTRREMEGLFTGLNDQFPELASEIARATGSVGLSFDAIMQDPARFAGTIASMFRSMDQNSPAAQRLRAVLEQMGPQFMFLVQGGEESARALEASMGSVEGVEGAFSNMSRAAGGATRTFSENMELVEESFRHRLDRMARRHYPNFERSVLQRQRRAYLAIGDTIQSVAEKRGPVGTLMRSMIAFRRGGFTGLVEGLSRETRGLGRRMVAAANEAHPALGRMAEGLRNLADKARDALPFLDGAGAMIFDMAGSALPAATALGALGLNFSTMARYANGAIGAIGRFAIALGPLGIVIAIAAGIYLLVTRFEQIQGALANAGETVRLFGARFLEWATNIDWANLAQRLVSGIVSIFTGAGRRLTGLAGDAAGAAMDPMWVELGANIRDGVRDIFLGLFHAIPEFGSGLWTAITNLFSDPEAVRQAITSRIADIGAFLGPAFESAFQTLGDIGGRIWEFLLVRFNVQPLIDAIQRGDVGGAILEGLLGATGLGFLRQFWERLFGGEAVTEGISGIAGTFGEIGRGIWDSMQTWIELAAPIWDEFVGMFREIQGVFAEVWADTIQPLIRDVARDIMPMIEEIFGIQLAVDDVGGSFENIQGGVRGFFESVQRGWRIMQPFILGLVREWLPRVVSLVRMWADGVRVAVGVFRRVWAVVGPFLMHVARGFRILIETAWEFWTDTLLPILVRAASEFRRIFQRYILPMVRRVFRTLGTIVNVWWRRRIRPVLRMLWERFSSTFTRVWRTGRAIFNFLQRHITNRIRQAALVFHLLGARWRATKEVLASGFRAIAAEVNRWLVVPFVRLRGMLVGMADTVRLAFLRVKLGVLEMLQTIVQGFQGLVRRLGPVGAPLARALQPAVDSIQQQIESVGGTRTRAGEIQTLQAAIRQEQQANQQEIDAANQRAADARTAVVQAEQTRRRVEREARVAMAHAERMVSEAGAPEVEPERPRRPVTAARPAARERVVEAAPRVGEEPAPEVAASRRREAEEERRTRETEELAEAIAISEFGSAAREQMRDAMMAAIERASRGRGRAGGRGRVIGTEDPQQR